MKIKELLTLTESDDTSEHKTAAEKAKKDGNMKDFHKHMIQHHSAKLEVAEKRFKKGLHTAHALGQERAHRQGQIDMHLNAASKLK